MPATFVKINSFIGNFQDFCLYLMQILIVNNSSGKVVLKNTSLLLKNAFKSSLFKKKIEHVKQYFCNTVFVQQ